MTKEKLKEGLILMAIVFVGAIAVGFLGNVTNVFEVDWSTWQIILSGAVTSVVSAALAWLAPFYKQFGLGSN